METLIVKLGATGDVVRTTPLLRRLDGQVVWLTAGKNKSLVEGLLGVPVDLQIVTWEDRSILSGRSFDLVIHLEDDEETAGIQQSIRAKRLFGAYRGSDGQMGYTAESSMWFDLSLISRFGRDKADKLKLENRRTYQDMLFYGLGFQFTGEEYFLPPTASSPLTGDVAIAPEAGKVWPMKKWAHYDWLKTELEQRGLKVNYLPTRATLLEHLADVRGHRCLVSGDSLPMHLALGSRIPCVALFNCTSPWEIHEYGFLTKFISPLLDEFFYKREFDARATTAILKESVLAAVLQSAAVKSIGVG
jgi:heptosyltransferase-2